jgi:hypothetical protein
VAGYCVLILRWHKISGRLFLGLISLEQLAVLNHAAGSVILAGCHSFTVHNPFRARYDLIAYKAVSLVVSLK